MFGRRRGARPAPPAAAQRRHGRRAIRSSLTGPDLPDPSGRITLFERDARSAVALLQSLLPDELRGVGFGFQSVPTGRGDGAYPQYFAVDRRARTIVMFRVPIQRARVLHVDDAEHRRYFIEHCVYLAVCEYLGRPPWDVLPGRFDHY